MGLDSNLYAEYYVWKDGDKDKIKISGIKGFNKKLLDSVCMDIGYWRKANAIHAWFVKNAQDDEDDCKRYFVSREMLERLRKECKMCLKYLKIDGGLDAGMAENTLPTKSGFMFGCTDYDEYYVAQLKHTIGVIDNALKLGVEWDFYYQASW